MQSPQLSSELHDLIERGNSEELRSFSQSSHPAAVAESISELSPMEAWQVLRQARQPLRAEIFSHLGEEMQVEMVTTLRRDEVARLVADMPPDDRADLFKPAGRDPAGPGSGRARRRAPPHFLSGRNRRCGYDFRLRYPAA